MKQLTIIALLILCVASNSYSQSLKDLLFSGKLKNDSGTVVRKGEDLTGKLDTATKKSVVDVKKTTPQTTAQQAVPVATPVMNQPVTAATDVPKTVTSAPATQPLQEQSPSTEPSPTTAPPTTETATSRKDNNSIWKAYADSLTKAMNADFMQNKKVKSGTYYVLVDYVIETDGQISVAAVTPTPENTFVQNMVKESILQSAPKLNPILDGAGRPRKVNRKQNFVLTK